MTDSNLVIVSIMGGGDFNGSGSELHVDDDRVGDNRDSAIDERVDCKFSVKMLQVVQIGNTQRRSRVLTVYLESSGCTAIAVSPSIVSGRVVAMMIFSSVRTVRERTAAHQRYRYPPDPSIGYAKEVRTPNSNFSLAS
jgi:hypothetical protein